jgi:hypothetical protein
MGTHRPGAMVSRGPTSWNRGFVSERSPMFFFFSNRLGCLGSILVSFVITGILLLLLSR